MDKMNYSLNNQKLSYEERLRNAYSQEVLNNPAEATSKAQRAKYIMANLSFDKII